MIGTIRGGARGYVTKTITGPELVDAIIRVAGGDAVFSPRLAGFVLDAFAGSIDVAAVDEDLDRLTEREREVMRLIARGYAYKEVAKELFISVKTVETHMSSVLRKLQLSEPPRAHAMGIGPQAPLSAVAPPSGWATIDKGTLTRWGRGHHLHSEERPRRGRDHHHRP